MEIKLNQPIKYRMNLDGFAWHFNTECELYPEDNYVEKTVKTHENFMMICITCRTEIEVDNSKQLNELCKSTLK